MLSLSFDLSALTGKPTAKFATVDHPFNYVLRMNEDEKACMFEAQLQQLAASRGETSIRQLVQDEANRGGSVCLNSFGRFAKWISASIMPPPSLVPAR